MSYREGGKSCIHWVPLQMAAKARLAGPGYSQQCRLDLPRGSGAPAPGMSDTAFSGHCQGADGGVRQLTLNDEGFGLAGSGLTCQSRKAILVGYRIATPHAFLFYTVKHLVPRAVTSWTFCRKTGCHVLLRLECSAML